MYKLTQSGLLTSSSKDVILSDLIKKYKESNDGSKKITYDKDSGEVFIRMEYGDTYTIKLTPEQKFNYENNISDPHLNKIRNLIEFNDAREFAKNTVKDARDGELPVTVKGINAYSSYLNAEIAKSGAKISKQFVVSYWPLLSFVASIFLWKMCGQVVDNQEEIAFLYGSIAFMLDVASLVGGIYKTAESLYYDKIVFFEKAPEELEKIRINLLKKQDLRTWKKDLNKQQTPEEIIAENSSFIADQKKSEKEHAIEINDETLGEIHQILDLIRQLPEEEQDEYAERIIKITKDYQEKITKIINHDRGLTFGLAGDVQSLRFAVMPNLISIRSEIEEKLYRQEQLRKVNQECESILSAAGKPTYNEWSDDLTEGNMARMYRTNKQEWSDDLTEGNMAKMY